MVMRPLSGMQTNSSRTLPQRADPLARKRSRFAIAGTVPIVLLVVLLVVPLVVLLGGCSSWPGGTYHGPSTGRVIEFKAGTAYLTEGRSTQAIPYEVHEDKVVLKLPFTNEVLRRMPDGSLTGMGERLVKVDSASNETIDRNPGGTP